MNECAHIDDAAAYVLGALPDDELAAFAAHLEVCEVCRREVAELRPAADTLPLSAPPAAPPPELKDRIMATVRAEAELLAAAGPEADRPPCARRARRRIGLAGLGLRPAAVALAAGLLIAAGVAGGLIATRGDGSRTVPAAVRIVSAPNASATLVTSSDGRAQLRVRNMPMPPRGSVYQVWLKRRGQPPTPSTALFSVDRTGHADVTVPESTKGTEQLLVTREPDGGSRTPTSAPVIIATSS
ncbi:MAG: anti-sigma factor [Solirubrobacteraceae bacterium]